MSILDNLHQQAKDACIAYLHHRLISVRFKAFLARINAKEEPYYSAFNKAVAYQVAMLEVSGITPISPKIGESQSGYSYTVDPSTINIHGVIINGLAVNSLEQAISCVGFSHQGIY